MKKKVILIDSAKVELLILRGIHHILNRSSPWNRMNQTNCLQEGTIHDRSVAQSAGIDIWVTVTLMGLNGVSSSSSGYRTASSPVDVMTQSQPARRRRSSKGVELMNEPQL